MTWFKVDDGFWSHPKVGKVSDAAVALWVRAGCYSQKYRLSGHIPEHVIDLLGGAGAAAELVEVRLWERTETGWKFHQWRRWQDVQMRTGLPATPFEPFQGGE